MLNVSLKIDSKKLEKYLASGSERVTRALQTAIAKGTLTAEGLAKRNSPFDTGRLASSIHSEIRPMFGQVQTNTEYAIFVHDGTRYMRPRPWMQQAADEVSGQMDAIIDAEINAAIE